MTGKPPLPAGFEEFQRITVDESDGSAFGAVLRIGGFAADLWPYEKPGQTPAQITHGQVREALLHLLELGLIDIDEERLGEGRAWPAARESAREA